MLIYNPKPRAHGALAGVADYDWSLWTGAPLSDDIKAKAATIADGFKSQADADAYEADSTDPLAIKFAVKFAVTAKKQPTFQTTFVSSATYDPKAVEILLPVGGLAILNEPDTVQQQKSKEAADLAASLLTDSAKKAIPANALDVYFAMLAPILTLDKNKRAKSLESVLARLRIWPILNRISYLAQNELDPIVAGESMTLKEVNQLVATAKSMLPPDDSQTGDQPRKELDLIPSLIKAVKDAEVALMKAQLGQKITFDLYEWHDNFNAKHIVWIGPVPVNPRVGVATLSAASGKASWEYPIPDVYMMSGQHYPVDDKGDEIAKPSGTNWRNPAFVADVPAMADYIPMTSYDQGGYGVQGAKFNGPGEDAHGVVTKDLKDIYNVTSENDNVNISSKLKGLATPGDYGILKYYNLEPAVLERLNDQSMRLWGKPYKGNPSLSSKDLYKDTKSPMVTYIYTLGSMIAYGLWLDPEWGGGFAKHKTGANVAADITPYIRKAHDKIRAKLMGEGGEWTKLQKASSTLMGVLDKISLLPTVPVTWKALTTGSTVLSPYYDWELWTKAVTGDTPWHKNLRKVLGQQNAMAWNGKYTEPQLDALYTELVGALKEASEAMVAKKSTYSKLFAWTPGAGEPLPYPLVYPMGDALVAMSKIVASNAAATLAGLSDAQKAYIAARAKTKASALLAMKTSEAAALSQASTDDMIKTLQELADSLYGCTIKPPPAGTNDIVKYYTDQLKKCEANPNAESMVGKLNALLAQYADLKAKSDAGDTDATAQLAQVASEIAELKEDMSLLVSTRVSRRKRATDNTTGRGGTSEMLGASAAASSAARQTGSVIINVTGADGKPKPVEITVTPTKSETDGVDGADKVNKETTKGMQDDMGYVIGSGEVLKDLVSQYDLPVDSQIVDDINANASVAKTVIPPVKSGSLWWLLLLAAAVAANRK